eukprot:3260014-Pleurochrysis_carterae.AAC.1
MQLRVASRKKVPPAPEGRVRVDGAGAARCLSRRGGTPPQQLHHRAHSQVDSEDHLCQLPNLRPHRPLQPLLSHQLLNARADRGQ